MSALSHLAVAMAVVLAIGDATASTDEITAEHLPRPIIGGEATEPGEFAGVVALIAGSELCSGTVVADRLVLTAGHCLAGLPAETEIEVFFGDQLDATNRVAVASHGVHPQFCPDCAEDVFDYGYVVLAADFTVPDGFILPITTQQEWDEAMVVGREVTVVGYGEDPESDAVDHGIGIKRKVTTTIGRQTAGGLEFFAGGMLQDSCRGDSGAPAFARVGDGTLRLAGITSRGSDPCGDGGYYGAPYPALCWVRDETGVDLVGPACSDCDCLQTVREPEPQDDGGSEEEDGGEGEPAEDGDPSGTTMSCACASAPVEDGGVPWWSFVAVALYRVRSRRRRR